MGQIGLPEILIVLAIVLLIFGPKRLPGLGRSLGSGMREFKDAVTGRSKDDDPDEIEPPKEEPTTVTNASAADESASTSNRPKAADAS